ncbi:MAG TPA: DUF6691 family protein [Oligoflexus sp.]|uniref:DUF6691 family protein n=1 Tax=Oligoflexus sp. TaxID=1971216 RepID=UPI002D4F19DB|nr:DUF6691 family protein [Oligoflexus sp.]HYX36814.1 DUF6691 family protein [Oligoflexus sp.]
MKNGLAALIVGFIFALGLGLSGMTQPQKVIGFLDLFGEWDPSLMFVMIGAIGVHMITYRLIRKRNSPLLATEWKVPTQSRITPALLMGAVLFGIGWGLAGFCPGPAVASLASLSWKPVLFVVSMLLGMLIFRQLDKTLQLEK